MGGFKLAGQYGEYEQRSAQPKDKSYMVGLTWNFAGKHDILGSYQNAEQGSADCDMYSVGYRYDVSKRTFLIASYTEVDNTQRHELQLRHERVRLRRPGRQGLHGGHPSHFLSI